MSRWLAGGLVIVFAALTSTAHSQTREQKVREDRRKVEAEGFWIYNDWPRARQVAKESGKPILVVLRCLPCEQCVKLDDDLMEKDPIVRPLLDKFVCLRQISTNGLDLSLFQYDTDQSFAVFLLNADETIYGRFGTRSHRTEWLGDVSLKGLAAALQGALELHAKHPQNRDALASKRGAKPEFASPELFPSLKEKYTASLNYSGNVVQSCIHCHQIGDAQRDLYRSRREPLPESLLFPYPHPKSVGLILDPDHRALIKEVSADSLADQAGFREGDELLSLAGQPLLSMADVQWVLHQTPAAGASIPAVVRRGSQELPLELKLPAGWRRASDISWRVSSWGLRRMCTGGLVLEEASAEERASAGAAADQMALRVKFVGQYNAHAASKKAGFQVGDVILAFDGRSDLIRESDLFQHAMTKRQAGDIVNVTVWRPGSKKLELKIPMQE